MQPGAIPAPGLLETTNMAKQAQPKALNAHAQRLQAQGVANRAAAVDVVNVAYDGIEQQEDWGEERQQAALSALLSMVRTASAFKAKDGVRPILTEHRKALPADIVKAIEAKDKANARRAVERHAKQKAKPTSKEKAIAAQGQDDADDTSAPDQAAVVAVVQATRQAEKGGKVPKGSAKAVVQAARKKLSLLQQAA